MELKFKNQIAHLNIVLIALLETNPFQKAF